MQKRDLLRVGFYEVDIRLHLRDAVVPVIFVLDGDVTVEILLFELFKAGSDIDDSRAGDDDLGLAHFGLVLEVDADDAAIEDAQALDGDEVRCAPVAEIGAGTYALIAAFDNSTDVERIPDLVFRVAHGATVFVEGDFDIGAYRCGFPCNDLLGGFSANGVQAHGLGKIHDTIDFVRVWSLDDPVVDCVHTEAFALGKEFLPRLFRHGVMNFDLGVGLQFLAWVELDHVATGFLGLGDSLEGGEILKRVSLRANEPALLAKVLGDRSGLERSGNGECGDDDIADGFH